MNQQTTLHWLSPSDPVLTPLKPVRVREYNNVMRNCPKPKEVKPIRNQDLENQFEGRRVEEERIKNPPGDGQRASSSFGGTLIRKIAGKLVYKIEKDS
jgi:hypothetical protein